MNIDIENNNNNNLQLYKHFDLAQSSGPSCCERGEDGAHEDICY